MTTRRCTFKNLGSLVLVLCVAWLAQPALAADLQALLVTGQNNHAWKLSSPILKELLEQTGLFEVDVATSPPGAEGMENFRPDFAAYQVVVLDYNGASWSEATQTAFVQYVRAGGGVVSLHAANNSFPDWPEYNKMIGVGGWGGRDESSGPYLRWRDGAVARDMSPGAAGGHGPQHAFQIIVRDGDHPIMRGLPQRWMHAQDELYERLRGPAKNVTVLATAFASPEQSGSGEHEPMLMTISYGQGRIFHTTLGHVWGAAASNPSIPSLECAGFITTLQRGAEWAATGRVTQAVPADFPTAGEVSRRSDFQPPGIESLLVKIATYEFGQSLKAQTLLTEMIRQAGDSPDRLDEIETQLLAFLNSDATWDAKTFVLRKLSMIGSDESVPTLARMLANPQTADMARYSLQRIPGKAADRALLAALPVVWGKTKVGIINSLGVRRTTDAVDALAGQIDGAAAPRTAAALSALGNIADASAAKALSRASEDLSGPLRRRALDANLNCADQMLARGESSQALAIYRKLYATRAPAIIRIAALRGIVTADADRAASIIADVLRADDASLQQMAMGLIRQVPGRDVTRSAANALGSLNASMQVQLLGALADRGDAGARSTAVAATKSSNAQVRGAALAALGSLGNASDINLLAGAAAETTGPQRQAARQSLYRLRGEGVDAAIMDAVGKSNASAKRELIRAIDQRRVYAGEELLLKSAKDADAQVRRESLQALRTIAEPDHLPELVDLLLKASSNAERDQAERTVVAVAQKIEDRNRRAQSVLAVLPSASDLQIRSSLLRVLGRIADSHGLDLLRAVLADQNDAIRDTAVRALSQWPTPEPMADLHRIATDSENETHAVLALRGYIRMIGLSEDRSEAQRVELYRATMAVTDRVEEKNMILSGVAQQECLEALQMAGEYLDDENLRQEAQSAMLRIARATRRSHPQKTQVLIEKLVETTSDDSVRDGGREILSRIR